jgi:hypothetical protein
MATTASGRSGQPVPGAKGDEDNVPARGARDHWDKANTQVPDTETGATPKGADTGSPAAEATKGNASSKAGQRDS